MGNGFQLCGYLSQHFLVHFLLGLFLVDNLFRGLAYEALVGELAVNPGNLTLKSLLFLGKPVELLLVVYKVVKRNIDFSTVDYG